jgi:pyruvate,water dikinase
LKEIGYSIYRQKVETTDSIRGNIAYTGKVSGSVCKIFSRADISKFRKGNILVAPMTTPWYLPLMKNAKAFVTDEGGVTCHAAVVAREFKKPCIIGTKIATQVLKDGDIVEVDADTGVVKKLKNE